MTSSKDRFIRIWFLMVEYKTYINQWQDLNLKECGKLLKEHGVIKENNKYQITRYALNLLMSLMLVREQIVQSELDGKNKKKTGKVP